MLGKQLSSGVGGPEKIEEFDIDDDVPPSSDESKDGCRRLARARVGLPVDNLVDDRVPLKVAVAVGDDIGVDGNEGREVEEITPGRVDRRGMEL